MASSIGNTGGNELHLDNGFLPSLVSVRTSAHPLQFYQVPVIAERILIETWLWMLCSLRDEHNLEVFCCP